MNCRKPSVRSGQGALRLIASGSGARLVALPVGAACSIATAYLSIQYTGSYAYGYVSLVATLFLLMPSADFGLGVAIVNAVSGAKVGDAVSDIALNTIWRVIIRLVLISTVLTCITYAIASVGGWPKILSIPSELDGANFATALALSLYLSATPFGVGYQIMVGLGRTGEIALISTLAPLATTAVTYITIRLGAPPLYLSVGAAIGVLIASLALSLRGLGILGIGVRQLWLAKPATPPNRLAHSAISMLVITTGMAMALQSHRFVLSRFSTPEQLAVYSLMAQMYLPLLSVISMGAIALWPAYKQSDDKWRLWISSLKALAGFGALVGFIFAITSGFVANLVSSGEIRPSFLLSASFGTLILVMAIHYASGFFLTDESGLRFVSWCVVAQVGVTFALSPILSRHLGAIGPVLVSIIGILVTLVFPMTLKTYLQLTSQRTGSTP
jgi:hypothetical protein